MPASAIRKLVPYADAAKKQGVKVYHLNIGQPDIDSPECALNAVKGNMPQHVSYSHSAGIMELRQGLVEKYYRKIGIDIEVPEIIITVAGSESVNLALEITCDAGDEVIVLEPFYTNYNTFAFLNGITLKAIPTDIRNGFQVPPIEEFEKAITDRTRAILVCNPGNPMADRTLIPLFWLGYPLWYHSDRYLSTILEGCRIAGSNYITWWNIDYAGQNLFECLFNAYNYTFLNLSQKTRNERLGELICDSGAKAAVTLRNKSCKCDFVSAKNIYIPQVEIDMDMIDRTILDEKAAMTRIDLIKETICSGWE